MLYFNTLPKILTNDNNGYSVLLSNLVSRASLIEKLKNNPMLFYQYTIQEGDTPEMIANKYYGDSYRYWIILYSNEIMDPLWNWPLGYSQMESYLENKYATEAQLAGKPVSEYIRTTIHHYEKVITTTDLYTNERTERVMSIDYETYLSLVQYSETFENQNTSIEVTKREVSIYDYEIAENEAKREIKIMDASYASEMEKQLKTLMSE